WAPNLTCSRRPDREDGTQPPFFGFIGLFLHCNFVFAQQSARNNATLSHSRRDLSTIWLDFSTPIQPISLAPTWIPPPARLECTRVCVGEREKERERERERERDHRQPVSS